MTGLPGPADLPELPEDDRPPAATRPARPPADPVAVAAFVSGFIGIVAFGLVLALVTAVLAAIAGQRARESGRSLENAILAFGLAILDGVVWLVLHFLFDLNFAAG